MDALDAALRRRRMLPTYPPDHRPFMPVRKPGSTCSNCRWIDASRTRCGSPYFQKWNGSDLIPFAPGHDASDSCSDWWE